MLATGCFFPALCTFLKLTSGLCVGMMIRNMEKPESELPATPMWFKIAVGAFAVVAL